MNSFFASILKSLHPVSVAVGVTVTVIIIAIFADYPDFYTSDEVTMVATFFTMIATVFIAVFTLVLALINSQLRNDQEEMLKQMRRPALGFEFLIEEYALLIKLSNDGSVIARDINIKISHTGENEGQLEALEKYMLGSFDLNPMIDRQISYIAPNQKISRFLMIRNPDNSSNPHRLLTTELNKQFTPQVCQDYKAEVTIEYKDATGQNQYTDDSYIDFSTLTGLHEAQRFPGRDQKKIASSLDKIAETIKEYLKTQQQ